MPFAQRIMLEVIITDAESMLDVAGSKAGMARKRQDA